MSIGLDMSTAQMLRHGRDVLFTLCLTGGLVFLSATQALALDRVSLQFQFADPIRWVFLAVVAAIPLGWFLYRRPARTIGVLRLSAAMSGLFVLLSIPVLLFILAYNYWQNSATINATLNDVVAKTKRASIDDAQSLINPVAATL